MKEVTLVNNDIKGEKLEKLKQQLLEIPRPADVSATDLAKLSATVATFEKPEKIAQTS